MGDYTDSKVESDRTSEQDLIDKKTSSDGNTNTDSTKKPTDEFPNYKPQWRLLFLELVAWILILVMIVVPPKSAHGATAIIVNGNTYTGVLSESSENDSRSEFRLRPICRGLSRWQL